MSGIFYIYELADPRSDEVFYVGKGTRNRRLQHELDARRGVPGAKCDRIRSILNDGLRPKAEIIRTFEREQDAYDAEALLVESYGLGNLTNIVPGGGSAREYDPRRAARAIVLRQWKVMRRAIDCFNVGLTMSWDGLDLVKLGRDTAMRLRGEAGEEYFDNLVGAL